MHSFKGAKGQQCPLATRLTGSSKELLEKEIKPLVEQFMKERGLELSQEKTHITHITHGIRNE